MEAWELQKTGLAPDFDANERAMPQRGKRAVEFLHHKYS